MPTRFVLTRSELARQHKTSAVALLWSGGQDSLLSLELKKVGNALQIPVDMTLLMMGTTDELEAELRHVKSRRIEAITVETPRGGEAFLIPKAARKRTADPLGLNTPQKLSVIALHSGNATFDKSWTPIVNDAFFSPPVTIDELIAELPVIREL
jgi:hypothetical protein